MKRLSVSMLLMSLLAVPAVHARADEREPSIEAQDPELNNQEEDSYSGAATWSWDLNVTAMVDINSNWSLFALLNREALGSGIKNSPLVERTSAYSLITSLTYKF